MLSVVWVLDVGYFDVNLNQDVTMKGTGFCIHPDGYILTAAHLFPESMTDIQIRKIDDSYFRSSDDGHVRMIEKFDSFDVAVVKVEFSRQGDENGFNYAIFGDGDLFRGQEVINIGHPMKWVYTSVRGEICFPCVNDVAVDDDAVTIKEADRNEELCTAWYETPNYRIAADVIDRDIDEQLTTYGLDVPLIQINNLHISHGSSGGPVFNSTGQVVGMIVFTVSNMAFAVPVSVLRNLLQTSMEHDKSRSRAKKPRKEKKWKGKKKAKCYR